LENLLHIGGEAVAILAWSQQRRRQVAGRCHRRLRLQGLLLRLAPWQLVDHVQERHQLVLELRRRVLRLMNLRLNITQVGLQMSLDLVLKMGGVALLLLLLLVEQQLGQEHRVLSLVLLQLLVKILVLLNLAVKQSGHLIDLSTPIG
jgi:hypothetical protein